MGDGIDVHEPRVLMVDDEQKVADAYALRLKNVADVTVAYSGEQALKIVDSGRPPDVTLLDRHMPGLSGDEVLERLRDREIRTRAIMVTAIDPDLGILDMPFDDYLPKPVDKEDLHTAVDKQCQVLAHELLGEYFGLESKRAVIAGELSPETEDQLAEVEDRLSTIEARVTDLLPESTTMLSAFSSIDRGR